MHIPYDKLSLSAQRGLYARLNRAYINMEAVFSDETENFVQPFNPMPGDAVTVRIRTAGNDADSVTLHTVSDTDGAQVFTMSKAETDRLFDYYAVQITAPENPFRYYFTIYKNDRVYYYNKRGFFDTVNPEYHFRLVPGFDTPEWARGAIMYQIFPDRFCNGDPSNDVKNYEYLYLGRTSRAIPWDQEVSTDNICDFYGGDLRGIINKLDYLKSLGVEVLYLNPIFVSPSSHKYDIQDYDHVDPHFGVIVNDDGETLTFEHFNNRYATKYVSRTTDPANLAASDQLLAEMVEQAHEKGIRVMLDGVFNHCGSFNKWMDKAGFYARGGYEAGAYRDENSPYHDYFLWYDRDWPNNDCYDGWWGNENHPKLNFESSPALYAYIMDVARKWLLPPYNIDGWRLDVAADLGRTPAYNHRFWRDFRKSVKSANPEALILAEHYGDPSAWTNGGEWDSIMNYDAFMEPLTWFLTGVSKHSEECQPHLLNDAMAFENAMRYHMARLNIHSLQTAMNELSNHDHSRFLTRTNQQAGRLHTSGTRAAEKGVNKNVLMEAVVFQMTWPGAPTIYYGDEAGLAGWTDPDNRRPFPWGAEDEVLTELHRAMAALRSRFPVLRKGSAEFILNDYGFISFGRWDGEVKLVVALNNNAQSKDVTIPVWKLGCTTGRLERVLATYDGRVQETKITYPIVNGTARVVVPAFGAMVLRWV